MAIMPGARYVRYIGLTLVGVFIIALITSTSTSHITAGSVKDQYDRLKQSWAPHLSPGAGTDAGRPQDQSTLHPSAPQAGTSIDPDKEAERLASGSLAGIPGETKWNPIPELKAGSAPGPRQNATFVTLARNSDVWEISKSIRHVEDRFNHRYNYDWVFLNDQPFDDEFKRITTNLCSGRARYGLIPQEHWSFPTWIDQKKAEDVRKDMKERKIIYGDSVSYRHMCRYESGFFFRHPIMNEYSYYWRVEPSIDLFCDIEYDAFEFMNKNNKKYSFVISLYEYRETIPTLWDSTKTFMSEHPEHMAADNSMEFLSDDGGKTYNHCHFWSNFEIGSLDWLRSDAYLDFFDRLDKDGGFFYERWGDAPVHSIGAGLTLNRDEIHFFEDIGYYHVPFTHCPTSKRMREEKKCHCNPDDNFDWNGYSCTSRFFDMNGMKKPEGYDKKGH